MIKLVASEGMVFTNGETWGKIIYLGKNDKAENWWEITEEEAREEEDLTDSEALDIIVNGGGGNA